MITEVEHWEGDDYLPLTTYLSPAGTYIVPRVGELRLINGQFYQVINRSVEDQTMKIHVRRLPEDYELTEFEEPTPMPEEDKP